MRSTLRRRLRRWRRFGAVRRRPATSLGVMCALLLMPGAAAADPPSWAPPRELSTSDSAPLNLGAAAGIASNGGGVVLWHGEDGVQAVVRPARRGFGDPRTIAGSSLSMPDLLPELAFDERGAAIAVWAFYEPHPRFVEDGFAVDYSFGLRVAARGPHGGFGRAQTLTDELDADPAADAAFDPDGNAVVIWSDDAGLHASARPAGERRFGRAQIIGQTRADPQVTVGASGSAVAAWTGHRRHGGWAVRAMGARSGAALDRRRSFSRAAALDIPGLGRSKPVIAIDGRSAVTAAWSDDGRVMAATCRASGRCGRAQALSRRGEQAVDPHVAVNDDGTAVVAWRSDEGVSAALRTGHRGFGSPGRLASLEDGQTATDLDVTVGPGGDAAAIWTIHEQEGDRVQAALRHGPRARFANASWLTGEVPGASWSDPDIVLDEHGDAIAVWGAMIDGRPSIMATAFDAER